MARATRNPDFLQCKEERNQESFFKALQSGDMSSENMRAIPQDFARNFSDKELSRMMKIKTQWGSSWEVGISKNPRFYFMEKSGWEKFVWDNALGDNEFLTFTHKGQMRFTVKIFKKDGKEMIQPPQSRAFLASSSRIKTEQYVKMEEEVVVPSESSSPGEAKTAASGARFSIVVPKAKSSYLHSLHIPISIANKLFPKKETVFKIHHPDSERSWEVVYKPSHGHTRFANGWTKLRSKCHIASGDTCIFSVIQEGELRLTIQKP